MLTYMLFKTKSRLLSATSRTGKQAEKASQMLTYTLFKTQNMLFSVTSRNGHLDADLHTVQNPEYALVSNKQEGSYRSSLTYCTKPRACSDQK